MTKRIFLESSLNGHPFRAWKTFRRWSDPLIAHGSFVIYYVENGMLAFEGEMYGRVGHEFPSQTTMWNFDGTVQQQVKVTGLDGLGGQILNARVSAPWLWSVQDQTEPTDPQWITEHGKQ